MDKQKLQKKLTQVFKDYKYILIIIAAGIVLLLLPSTAKTLDKKKETENTAPESALTVSDLESRLEDILSTGHGVGRVKVMLTLYSSSESVYENTNLTTIIYPRFQGAVIICDGADDSALKLQITNAVSSITGIPSNKIEVIKMKGK